MGARHLIAGLFVASAFFHLQGCFDSDDDLATGNSGSDADTDSDTDSDTDGDGDTDTNTYNDTDDGCDAGGNWYDPETGLCWQEPPSESDMSWHDALEHCEDLETGGFDDWRLPDIDELISTMRGCANGDETGDMSPSECAMIPAGCSSTDSCEGVDDCMYCSNLEGPGYGGCYWDPELSGECWRYWSASSRADDDSYAWEVVFYDGAVDHYEKGYDSYARCVRSGQ